MTKAVNGHSVPQTAVATALGPWPQPDLGRLEAVFSFARNGSKARQTRSYRPRDIPITAACVVSVIIARYLLSK